MFSVSLRIEIIPKCTVSERWVLTFIGFSVQKKSDRKIAEMGKKTVSKYASYDFIFFLEISQTSTEEQGGGLVVEH